jgi:folate-binding protein YgfZ
MAEALPNPLHQLHQQAQAEFQPYGDVEVVSTFGEPQAEYAAIRKGCGLMDLPQRGSLELTGKDRHKFLNNLLTNQTWDKDAKTGMAAGKGAYAFFLNTKGRVVTDMNVLELGESTWLEMDARMVGPLRGMLDKYLFAEQVKMVSRVAELHEIALHGPGATGILGRVIGRDVAGLAPLESVRASVFEQDVVVWRDDPAGVPGFHLVTNGQGMAKVWMGLVTQFAASAEIGKRELRPVGWAAYNATRIEGGRAMFGIDFDESILPAETGAAFDRAVSLTKGCYLGQEIVARMHARGQVAKKLVGIRMEGEALPVAGVKIFDPQQNEVGGVTSSTISPVLSNVAVCLGYVKRPLFEVGTELLVPAEGQMRRGKVVELPFVR